MTKNKKLCIICHEKPATVPDRNRPGRLVNRICSECHKERLRGDFKNVLSKIKRNNTKESTWKGFIKFSITKPKAKEKITKGTGNQKRTCIRVY